MALAFMIAASTPAPARTRAKAVRRTGGRLRWSDAALRPGRATNSLAEIIKRACPTTAISGSSDANPGLPMSERDDDSLLTATQHAALQAARRALVHTIERQMDGDQHQVVQLVFIAVSGLFADMLALSASLPAGDAKLVDAINQQLAESGWRLVPIARH
jgi:hypothetical protein